jgi:endonuclease/exonuclease/phosphatase (EEP) superfamily protein YafD
MLLYSRLELVESLTTFLVRDDTPSMRSVVRLRSGDEIALYCTHPRPPLPDTDTYGRDAELVLIAGKVDAEDRPSIVMGDLNDVAWSYTTTLFQRLSGTLDPRIGRGMYNTFHARHRLLRYPLDHVFHTPEFQLVELRRLQSAGSDHFPIFAHLQFEPHVPPPVEVPKVDAEDLENAAEILEDAEEEGVLDSSEAKLQ